MSHITIDSLNPLKVKKTGTVQSVHFLIPGAVGKLEAMLDIPDAENSRQAIGVVCHPHPLYGGSMTNKVAHTIAKAYTDLDVPALRFHLRGVGQSDGEFDNAVGEQDDLLAAVDWMRDRFPQTDLWLAGFSFGAYIALACAAKSGAQRLVTVAPAVTLYDMSALELPAVDWLLIQGDADEVVPSREVLQWAESLKHPPEIVVLPGASHFFHSRLNELREIIVTHVTSTAT